MKRGRPSSGDLSVVVDLTRRPPPPPPADLSPSQAETWRNTMGSLPADYIRRVAFPVLVELCRHVDRSRTFEHMIATFRPEWAQSDEGLARLDKLAAMCERESRAVLACCRSLRLTPSSVVQPISAGRRMLNERPPGPRPWDKPD